jgi:hypothetical protein
VTLRVFTWNMDHWKRMRDDTTGQSQRDAWSYLQSLSVDVLWHEIVHQVIDSAGLALGVKLTAPPRLPN